MPLESGDSQPVGGEFRQEKPFVENLSDILRVSLLFQISGERRAKIFSEVPPHIQ